MRQYDTPSPITAILAIPAGNIRLVAADRRDTTVDIRPADPSKSRDVTAAERTTAGYTDGILRVTSTARNQLLGNSGSVEVTVELPTGSRVEVTVAATRFHTAGRLGDVTFEGAQGDVEIDEVATLRLSTSAGDVTVGRLHGAAGISTEKGDIRVIEAISGTVELRTRAGGISIGAAAGVSAALDAGTGHGRVTNNLRNDGTTGLEIRATTSYGDIVARSL